MSANDGYNRARLLDGSSGHQILSNETPPLGKIEEFILIKELGRGSFAKVFLGINEITGESRAVKRIDAARLSKKLQESLDSEIKILRDFPHENIVKL